MDGRKLVGALRDLYRSLANPPPNDASRECSQFIARYQQVYGKSICPPFASTPFYETVAKSHRDVVFTLVYVHCWDHVDTPSFCKHVLGSSEVTAVLKRDDVVVWGGDVFAAETRSVSHMLKATTFPFLALLSPSSSPSTRRFVLLQKISGHVSPKDLAQKLSEAIVSHRDEVEAERRRQRAREEERRLRESQDAAYQSALLADQKREEEEEAKRETIEREAKRARAQAEIALSKEREKSDELEEKKRALGDEPRTGDGTSTFVFRLPDGSRLTRRFANQDKLLMIFHFLDIALTERDGVMMENYAFTAYPDRRFAKDRTDLSMSLTEAKLTGRVAVFVQNLDA